MVAIDLFWEGDLMGKGKNDRSLSNRVRRKRKAKAAAFFGHIERHPNYYNESNPIPYRVFEMLIIFRMLYIAVLNKPRN